MLSLLSVSFVVGLLLEILSLGIISCFRIEILAEWRVPVPNECPLWICLSVAILPIVFLFLLPYNKSIQFFHTLDAWLERSNILSFNGFCTIEILSNVHLKPRECERKTRAVKLNPKHMSRPTQP